MRATPYDVAVRLRAYGRRNRWRPSHLERLAGAANADRWSAVAQAVVDIEASNPGLIAPALADARQRIARI